MQLSERRTKERLFGHIRGERTGLDVERRQAHAVDGNRVTVTRAFSHRARFDDNARIVAALFNVADATKFFDDPSEHFGTEPLAVASGLQLSKTACLSSYPLATASGSVPTFCVRSPRVSKGKLRYYRCKSQTANRSKTPMLGGAAAKMIVQIASDLNENLCALMCITTSATLCLWANFLHPSSQRSTPSAAALRQSARRSCRAQLRPLLPPAASRPAYCPGSHVQSCRRASLR